MIQWDWLVVISLSRLNPSKFLREIEHIPLNGKFVLWEREALNYFLDKCPSCSYYQIRPCFLAWLNCPFIPG